MNVLILNSRNDMTIAQNIDVKIVHVNKRGECNGTRVKIPDLVGSMVSRT